MTANTKASELDPTFLMLQQMPRPWKGIDFPRKDPVNGDSIGRIALQLLSQQDQLLSAISAAQYVRRFAPELMSSAEEYRNIYQNALSAEMVHRACLNEEMAKEGKSRPFFPSVMKVHELLDSPEVGALVTQYVAMQSELEREKTFDSSELDLWVDDLHTNGLMALVGVKPETLGAMLVAMANKIFDLSVTDGS